MEEIKLFFLSEISVYLSHFFFLYINDFLMVQKQGAFWILSSIVSETAKNQREEKQKKQWFRKIFFHFQIFQTFGNLKIDFCINLNKSFWSIINTFEIMLIFCQNFDKLGNWFEACRYTRDIVWHIYSCIKFCCPQVRRSWVIKV